LRVLADTGDSHAAESMVYLLVKQGDLDTAIQMLRDRANANDRDAAKQLADLLAKRGDLEGLRALAPAQLPIRCTAWRF
jgi:hypothetical protein